jgi:predicted transcriptional regulator of viral defense system
MLTEKWERLSVKDLFIIANHLQVPSYISFMTALNIYEITTQVQNNFFESACLKRSGKFDIEGRTFNYYKLSKTYYNGFGKDGDFFIASKEKAFVDCLYLYSFGKYRFDVDSIDFEKLDKKKIKRLLINYPQKTQKTFIKIWKS